MNCSLVCMLCFLQVFSVVRSSVWHVGMILLMYAAGECVLVVFGFRCMCSLAKCMMRRVVMHGCIFMYIKRSEQSHFIQSVHVISLPL